MDSSESDIEKPVNNPHDEAFKLALKKIRRQPTCRVIAFATTDNTVKLNK